MTTLISFLGKGQMNSGKPCQNCQHVSVNNNGYREANYRFEDGQVFESQKYFGLVLAEKVKPKKIILLGTSGSMWDVFLEQGSDGLENEWVSLSDAVKDEQVTVELLKPFEKYLKKKLKAETRCVLIPFAKNMEEQIKILEVLSELLDENEKVILDVTHGFRHLPMLALVAARFLKRIKNIDVRHIYYGALEMTNKEDKTTPVLMLDGMLSMLDWIDALTTFDKDGDYGEFASLLKDEGLSKSKAEELKKASYFERITNAPKAKELLDSFMENIDLNHSIIFKLFEPQLRKRFTWFNADNRGLREQNLAKEYFRRRDYLRATIYAQEGVISNALYEDKASSDAHKLREDKLNSLAIEDTKKGNTISKFRKIRNALVHGSRDGNHEIVMQIIEDENKLRKNINDYFKEVFKKE